MDTDPMELLRNKVKEIKESRKEQSIDYANLTAPCGLPCFECYLYLAQDHPELQTMIAEVAGLHRSWPSVKDVARSMDRWIIFRTLPVFPCAQKKAWQIVQSVPIFLATTSILMRTRLTCGIIQSVQPVSYQENGLGKVGGRKGW